MLAPIILLGQNRQNDLHAKYAGDIVFAAEEIDFDNMESGILKEKFSMLDNIYARVFMEKPLAEYYEDFNWSYNFEDEKYTYNYITDIYFDGKKMISWLDEMPADLFRKNTVLDIVIAPSERDRLRYSVIANDWADVISELEDGIHEVRVEFRAKNVENPGLMKDPVSTGKFDLKVERDKLPAFKEKYRVGLPEASIIAPEVEEGILVASKNMYENMTPVKAVIIEPTGEYQFQRDPNGNVLSRSFIAVVALKAFNGNCYVRSARYKQDHRGNYQFDDVRMSQKLEDYLNYQIPCENIK